MTDTVRIIEVGPRDGLQNENQSLNVDDKVHLIENLAQAGLKQIEAASFVSPKWVPQMASSGEVLKQINRQDEVIYSALTPNIKGYELAVDANADEVAIFTAVSETFCQKNINCSIEESIERFKPLIDRAKIEGLQVRAYVSCVMGCPYEGLVTNEKVVEVARTLVDLGCYEVSLGDTIGVGTTKQTRSLLRSMLDEFSADQLALHFHDTYGQALANQFLALELGFRNFDSSVAGLGGCPYATGASGNVATEDLVYMLHGAGMTTGIDLNKLIFAGNQICKVLGRQNQSKVANALNKA